MLCALPFICVVSKAEATYRVCWTRSFSPERAIYILPAIVDTEVDDVTFAAEFARRYALYDVTKREVFCPGWRKLEDAKVGLAALLDSFSSFQRSGWKVRYLVEKKF